MNNPWTLQMLGDFRLSRQDQIIDRFSTRHAESLLAYLAYYSDRNHHREKLIEMLWPECEESAGRNRLNYTLSILRNHLENPDIPKGAILSSSRFAVQVDPQNLTTDVLEFETFLDRADAEPSPDEQCRLRMQAVERYRGELLPGRNHEWIFIEQARLSARYVDALIQIASRLEQTEDIERALEYALLARQTDPMWEEPYAVIIRTHLARRRYAEAIREYRQLEETLRAEYGVPPSAALQALMDAVPADTMARIQSPASGRQNKKQKRITGADQTFFSYRDPPKPATSFHGRTSEIAQILQAIAAKTSPITLTGAGGAGKTRLAIEVSRRAKFEYGYAVCFVDLSDVHVSTAAQFQAAFADLLHLMRSPHIEPLAQVIDFLARFPTLLVLDNYETCMGVAADTVRVITHSVPKILVLITSRQVLNVPGEHEIVVNPLALPKSLDTPAQQYASESVRLFADRARAVNSQFGVTDDSLVTIAELCRRLDGLPLAIEIAAAQLRVQSLEQILVQLQTRLDTFAVRENYVRDHHQTLRATIDWSYHRLPPDQQRRFALLSVFQGGWTAESAAAIWEDANALSNLHVLREHSLIRVLYQGGNVRFQMLDTLREYARDRLAPDDRERAQHRFALYFVRWTQANANAFEKIEQEQENVRQVLLWLQDSGHLEEALQLAVALKYFWVASRNAQYGQWWIEILLAADAELHAGVCAEVGAEAALCARLLRLSQEDGIHWRISLDAGGNPGHETISNRERWRTALVDRGAEIEAIQTQFALLEGFADPEKIAFALYSYGRILYHQSDRQAREMMERSLRLYRQHQHRYGVQMVLGGLGKLVLYDGEFTRAILLLTEKLEMARQSGYLPEVIHALWVLGRACQYAGNQQQADQYMEESLTLCRQQGDPGRLIALLKPVGTLALERQDYDAARVLLGERLALAQKLGSFQLQVHTLRALAEVAYWRADFAEAIKLSHRRLELSRQGNEPAEEASSAADVALVHICQAEYTQAVHHLSISLDLFGEELRCHYALEVCARLALAKEDRYQAVRFFATAARLRLERLVEIPLLLCIGRDPILEKLRSELTAETFAALWEQGHATPHTTAILEARGLLATT